MKTKTKARKAHTPPTDSVVGYIVRYELEENEHPLSYEPLNPEDGKLLLLSSTRGTVFDTHESAVDAIMRSIRFQIRYGYSWNEMYGPYVIDAVRAPVIA